MNDTYSVSCSPGKSAVPSGSEVNALNTPKDGGFERVMRRVEPPVFATVNDATGLAPRAMDPKSTVSGETVRCAGGAHTPDIGTSMIPTLVSRATEPEKVPSANGLNVTLTIKVAPAASCEPS